jgi:hypothetical protein
MMWTPDPSSIITAEQKADAIRAARLSAYKSAFDSRLDEVAQQRQYDNRLTIAAYVSSSNPQWSAEAQAFIVWRDACLEYLFEQLSAVEAGTIDAPTVVEFIAGMPVIDWSA